MNRLNITGYSISEYKLEEKKRTMNFHDHNTLELSYVTSGNFIFSYFNNKNEECEVFIFPKQLLIITPGFTHKTSIPDSLKSIGMELSLENGENVLGYLINSPYVTQFEESQALLNSLRTNGFAIIHDTGNIEYRIRKLQGYIANEDLSKITEAKYELDLKRLLLEILLCKQLSTSYTGSIHIKRAISLLESNHAKDISVSAIADSLNLSVSYLQHLFKAETRMSIKRKLNIIRVTHARQLIADTNYTIQKIASDVGYNSVQELNTNFKKIAGCSPSEFKRNKNEINPMRYFDYDYSYQEKIKPQ